MVLSKFFLNITGGPDLTLFEAQDASDIVSKAAGDDVNIIFGTSINPNLGDEVVVTVIATGIDSAAEEAASKQLPGRSHQVKAQPARPEKKQEERPVVGADSVNPTSSQNKADSQPSHKQETMVDPTSVWGLNNADQSQRRPTQPDSQQKDDSFDSYNNDEQDSISQIETSAQSDDDTEDIPFFKHRGEN